MTNNMACVRKAESGMKCPKMTTPQYRCFRTSLTPQSHAKRTFGKDQDACNGDFLGWLLESRKCQGASGHEI